MTESLADWLLVQLAADEQVARLMADATWPESVHVTADTEAVVNGSVSVAPGTSKRYKRIWDNSIVDDGWVVHESAVEVWSKDVAARVLADIESKRLILEEHYEIYRDIGWLDDGDEASAELPVCGRCVEKHSHFRNRSDVPLYPCRTVKLLALGFADRPGYQDTWRP